MTTRKGLNRSSTDPPKSVKYATLSWTADDVLTLFDCTEKQAHAFLVNNEKHLRDRLCELGWEVMQRLGVADGLNPRTDQQDD